MMMGAVYLTYSAYYVSISVDNVKNIIETLLNSLYMILFYLILKNSLQILLVLNQHLGFANSTAIQETLRLKIKMYKRFIIIIVAFFLFEIVVHGFLPLQE